MQNMGAIQQTRILLRFYNKNVTNIFFWIKENFFESTKLSLIQRNVFFDRISKKCFFDLRGPFYHFRSGKRCARLRKNDPTDLDEILNIYRKHYNAVNDVSFFEKKFFNMFV